MLKELKLGEPLSYVFVNSGSTDIEFYYVSQQDRGIGIGAFSRSRGELVAAIVTHGGEELLLGMENISHGDGATRQALEHLYNTYYGKNS
jgi:hypothetical protein